MIDFSLKVLHMNKEKPGKCKKNFYSYFWVSIPTIIGFGPLAGASPPPVHNTQTMPCLRWLCDGACLPQVKTRGHTRVDKGAYLPFGQSEVYL